MSTHFIGQGNLNALKQIPDKSNTLSLKLAKLLAFVSHLYVPQCILTPQQKHLPKWKSNVHQMWNILQRFC